MKEPKGGNGKILVAGDWHGSAGQASRVIDKAIDQGIDTIMQVGDFGIWRGDERFLGATQKRLSDNGIHLYFIDGNHENFPRLYAYPEEPDGTRRIRENITHLPRGYRWEWSGVRFLAVGGAASIDMHFREVGKEWWTEELLTDSDIEKSQDGGEVDIMFTHDSPSTAPNSITDDPVGQARAAQYFGHDALELCGYHRDRLSLITDSVKPVWLFHGHYHQFMSGSYLHRTQEPGSLDNFVIGLDEGGAPLKMHTCVIDLADINTHLFMREIDTLDTK